MKGKAYIFVFGGSSTLLLSFFLLVLMPRIQVEGMSDSTQQPYSAAEARGRHVYQEYGCVYCHSQQVRDPVAGPDAKLGWGPPSRPEDYVYDKPHLLGTSRTGPDLSNIGSRQPSAQWHHLHLYNPRTLVPWSIMPGHPFLYDLAEGAEPPTPQALPMPGQKGQWLVPSPEAQDLVEYLLSLKRDQR